MNRIRMGMLGLGMATLTTACGPGSGGTGGAGGAEPDGGATPDGSPTPVAADGAFVLTTTQGDPQKCMITGHTAQVGMIDASNRQAVVVDGVDMTKVSCAVSGATSLQVHAVIDDTGGPTGNYFELLIPAITPGATQSKPAQGNVVFSAAWTAGQPYSGPCDFYFTPATPETVDVNGGAGRAWVSFSCAGVTSGMSTCPVSQGYALFENCLSM